MENKTRVNHEWRLIKIDKDNNSLGKDEMYTYWYECPNCESTDIALEFNYCPKCGYQINWILHGKEAEIDNPGQGDFQEI